MTLGLRRRWNSMMDRIFTRLGGFIGTCVFAAFCYFAFGPMIGTIIFFAGTIMSFMEKSSDRLAAEAKKQTELLQEIRDAQNRR